MARYRNKKHPNLTDYVCDECGKRCGGGLIKERQRQPALVFCKTECKEEYFKLRKEIL